MTNAGEVIAELEIPKNYRQFRHLYAGAFQHGWPWRYVVWMPIACALVFSGLHAADPQAALLAPQPIAYLVAGMAILLLDAAFCELHKWHFYRVSFPTDQPIRVLICTDGVEWAAGGLVCQLPYGVVARTFVDADRMLLSTANNLGLVIPRRALAPADWDALVAEVMRRRGDRPTPNEPKRT